MKIKGNSRQCFEIESNLSKSKRSQITPIIIVAIVLVIGLGVYFVIPGSDNVEKVDPSVEPIYNFVQGCLEESSREAIIEVSRQGGYLNPPEDNFNGFPYYVKNGQRLMPTTDQIGEALSEYVKISTYFCVRGFEDFPSFNVERDDAEVKTVIRENRVDFSVRYPITITKGDKVFEIEKFEESVDTRLGEVIDLAEFLVEDQLDHPISLCLSCGYYISNQYEMDYNNLALDQGRFLHSISDGKIKIDNKPLELNFIMGLEVEG